MAGTSGDELARGASTWPSRPTAVVVARNSCRTGCRARAGAELRRHPALRLRLHPLHRLSVVHRLDDPAALRLGRLRQLREALRPAALVDGARQPRDLRHALHRHLHGRSAWSSPSCSTRRSAPRGCCGRSTSIRWRSPSSSPARRGSGSSIPASGSSTPCTMGLGEFHLHLDQGSQHGDLLRSSSPRSGSPPASSWRCSWRACAASTTRSSRRRRSTARSHCQLYRRIIIPMLRPAFLSAFVVLAHLAIKSYDLVVALTGGGPGRATELPATFMYSYTFTRNQMGVGAASAVIMLVMIASIIVPYLYSELRHGGARSMSVADARDRDAHRRSWRARDLCRADPLRGLLPAAALRDGGEFAEAAGGDPRGQHAGAAADLHARALAQRLVHGADRRAADGAQALFPEFHPDGRAGGRDLDAARRAQRLRADQVALPRRHASSSG